jgi:hypothetical protein
MQVRVLVCWLAKQDSPAMAISVPVRLVSYLRCFPNVLCNFAQDPLSCLVCMHVRLMPA